MRKLILLFIALVVLAVAAPRTASALCWDGGYCTPTPAQPYLYHIPPHQRWYDARDAANGGWHVPQSYRYSPYGFGSRQWLAVKKTTVRPDGTAVETSVQMGR